MGKRKQTNKQKNHLLFSILKRDDLAHLGCYLGGNCLDKMGLCPWRYCLDSSLMLEDLAHWAAPFFGHVVPTCRRKLGMYEPCKQASEHSFRVSASGSCLGFLLPRVPAEMDYDFYDEIISLLSCFWSR